jgi:hypothetical protein
VEVHDHTRPRRTRACQRPRPEQRVDVVSMDQLGAAALDRFRDRVGREPAPEHRRARAPPAARSP